ncbi:tail fiber protein [Pedobacter sp. KR3-3]|uniref:Tail fiber protein n=1 Tax=Pedobacter albus TaxID=3113905 RepID=A0ABU7I2U2_9SPHI|nr:tail fiber protein [Pedobacter sp. KR3-3]MEE1943782.1 tail fiber protein [Pedobacter sp. KR3-3]
MNGNNFIGEVRLYAGDKAPDGWVICDGRALDINQYMDLYVMLRETFGGDGQYFNVPDLRGRVPVHVGNKTDTVKLALADKAGAESVALSADNLPPHSHSFYVTENNGNSNLDEYVFISTTLDGNKAPISTYSAYDVNKKVKMSADSIVSTGAATSAPTLQPFLAMNYIICYEGVMSIVENYIGEVKLFPFWNDRLAKDWVQCNGQILPINSSTKNLSTILLTQYGGDGQTNFGVPDLNGRTPVGGSPNDPLYAFGKKLGAMATTLTHNNMPDHRHDVRVADGDGTAVSPEGNLLATVKNVAPGTHYLKGDPSGNLATMDENTVGKTGGATPVSNVQPVIGLVLAVALNGIYPSRS